MTSPDAGITVRVTPTSPRPLASDSNDDRQLAEIVERESTRLRRFVRQRVRHPQDAEDILQDVFRALVEANRLLMPINHITGWLFRVARNRIIDRLRTRTPESLVLDDLLPSAQAGPEEAYARTVLLDTLQKAIADLPPEQRDVFVAHEIEGRSFKALADATGVSVNTLLSRKRYAVLRLRERLRRTYDELTKP